MATLDIEVPIFKAGADEQRFVFGVVLVPDEVDSQGNVYSADEVLRAAHEFMEQYQVIGVAHSVKAAPTVRVVESCVAPCDMTIAGVPVKQGTWLMGIHVGDDELWRQVKAGQLTGLSVGGLAKRIAA